MNANELKIGNLVLIENKYCKVESIYSNGVRINKIKENRDVVIFYEDIKPISLSEEILNNSGFGMKYATDPQEPNALKVFFLGDFELLMFEDEQKVFYSAGCGHHRDVVSVHQLQNLYFALTGEELEVKL